jgi:AraC-like DNA-binding protein
MTRAPHDASATTLHPVAIARVMVNFAARHGVDVDTSLLGTGLTEPQLGDPEVLISRDQEMRLIENLMLALPQLPAPGFALGLEYNVATFGIWGFAMRTSRTLGEAVHRALRYLPLSTAYCALTATTLGDEFIIEADPGGIPQHLRQFLLERDTATAVNLVRELGLSGVPIRRLEYRGPAPDYVGHIATLCGLTPQYGSPRNAVVLSRQDVEAALPMYDAHLVRLLEDRCRAQLDRRQTAGVTGQVRQLLLGPLGLMASIEEVAQHLAMAPRSLRRRLDDEGTRFRDLVDAERRQLAARLLESTDMKIDEMALHLGYGDTASFTRAFRRWFECAPGAYRKRAAS